MRNIKEKCMQGPGTEAISDVVDRIDKSVLRAIVWHHKALPSDAKQWPEKQIFPSFPQTHVGFLSLNYFGCQCLNTFIVTCILKV